jgi:hypothetical protein
VSVGFWEEAQLRGGGWLVVCFVSFVNSWEGSIFQANFVLTFVFKVYSNLSVGVTG